MGFQPLQSFFPPKSEIPLFVSENMFRQFPRVLVQHFCVDPGLGVSLNFTLMCLKILQKHEKKDMDQYFEAAAPRSWLKNTTGVQIFYLHSSFLFRKRQLARSDLPTSQRRPTAANATLQILDRR